ncbi:hypothetical protein V8E53_012668 [Lactarius tabidus]
MSLPTIQNVITINSDGHHLILTVILILKHATFLLLSDIPWKSALFHADQHYSEANIDLKVQEHLASLSQEHSVEQLASFIMATDIEYQVESLADLEPVARSPAESLAESTPHQDLFVPSPSQSPVDTQVPVRRKEPWFKRVLGPLRKTTRKNK